MHTHYMYRHAGILPACMVCLQSPDAAVAMAVLREPSQSPPAETDDDSCRRQRCLHCKVPWRRIQQPPRQGSREGFAGGGSLPRMDSYFSAVFLSSRRKGQALVASTEQLKRGISSVKRHVVILTTRSYAKRNRQCCYKQEFLKPLSSLTLGESPQVKLSYHRCMSWFSTPERAPPLEAKQVNCCRRLSTQCGHLVVSVNWKFRFWGVLI